MKTALISVYDKTGIVEFAKSIEKLGYRILSTGGTFKVLSSAEVNVTSVSDITEFPEILDGRVKTLHPKVHAGILARRDKTEHIETLFEHKIDTIDMVVINLYPFKETINREDCTLEDAIENIDIGGPTMLRSAAKNAESVITVVDYNDYDEVVKRLESGLVTKEFKMKLQVKVFGLTSSYDALIANYLSSKINADFNDNYSLALKKKNDLRYGENSHQKAAIYVNEFEKYGLADITVLHGKEMSYNNYLDVNAAINLAKEFKNPACVMLKHTNPCGVAESDSLESAFDRAYKADPVSIFGGIIALNGEVNEIVANKINDIFIEIVIAKSYSEKALSILTQKKNIRLIEIDFEKVQQKYEVRSILGGALVQEVDNKLYDEIEVLTKKCPTEKELKDLEFAMKVVKHSKSNAIVIAKDKVTIGIGQGQVSRVFASECAVNFASSEINGAVLASDGFFPFADAIETAYNKGVNVIIQPAGSINDAKVIEKANELGMVMVGIKGIRHFKH